MSFSEIATIVGIFGVVFAIAFNALQVRELSHQRRIGNRASFLAAGFNSIERLHDIDKIIVERPYLHYYMYESKPLPRNRKTRVEVETITRMMADTIEYGLANTGNIHGTDIDMGWRPFALIMHEKCTMLRFLVAKYPELWPSLVIYWESQNFQWRP
ncbi:hypothetical protein ACFWYW_52490 [Nonomuraea sp. NPDC059023]|uniref:hypothetical protein n=1 Tax=unclassified Nonomuraea TaxID=2593643 RepID=UPI0036CAC626